MRDGKGKTDGQCGSEDDGAESVEAVAGLMDAFSVHCSCLGAHGALRKTNGFRCLHPV